MQHFYTKKRGFTLIELIVSVGIFSFVMVIGLGALLSISAGERKAETLKSVMNNLNFALESMSREVRTGTVYGCGTGGSCIGTPGIQIAFNPSDGSLRTVYKFEKSDAAACNQPPNAVGCIKRSIDAGGSYSPVTAPEVVVTNFAVYLVGQAPGDGIQPKATIDLSGYVQVSASQQTKFNLQTSITQRVYDQ